MNNKVPKKDKHVQKWNITVPATFSFDTYGQLVKWLREQHKWTQEELAEKLQTTQSSIARLETTTKSPSLRRMLKISNLFNLEMSAPTFGSLKDRKNNPNQP